MRGSGEKLKEFWLSQNIKLRPGVSDKGLHSFESRYGVRLPDDIWDYFSIVDGMDDGNWDGELSHFLPMHEVKPVAKHWRDSAGFGEARASFLFVDISIGAYFLGVRLSSDASAPSRVTFWGRGARPSTPVFGQVFEETMQDGSTLSAFRVADSFSQFVEAYLTDPSSVYPKYDTASGGTG